MGSGDRINTAAGCGMSSNCAIAVGRVVGCAFLEIRFLQDLGSVCSIVWIVEIIEYTANIHHMNLRCSSFFFTSPIIYL